MGQGASTLVSGLWRMARRWFERRSTVSEDDAPVIVQFLVTHPGGAILRSSFDVNSDEVVVAKRGEVVTLLEERGRRVRVKTVDNICGWASVRTADGEEAILRRIVDDITGVYNPAPTGRHQMTPGQAGEDEWNRVRVDPGDPEARPLHPRETEPGLLPLHGWRPDTEAGNAASLSSAGRSSDDAMAVRAGPRAAGSQPLPGVDRPPRPPASTGSQPVPRLGRPPPPLAGTGLASASSQASSSLHTRAASSTQPTTPMRQDLLDVHRDPSPVVSARSSVPLLADVLSGVDPAASQDFDTRRSLPTARRQRSDAPSDEVEDDIAPEPPCRGGHASAPAPGLEADASGAASDSPRSAEGARAARTPTPPDALDAVASVPLLAGASGGAGDSDLAAEWATTLAAPQLERPSDELVVEAEKLVPARRARRPPPSKKPEPLTPLEAVAAAELMAREGRELPRNHEQEEYDTGAAFTPLIELT